MRAEMKATDLVYYDPTNQIMARIYIRGFDALVGGLPLTSQRAATKQGQQRYSGTKQLLLMNGGCTFRMPGLPERSAKINLERAVP